MPAREDDEGAGDVTPIRWQAVRAALAVAACVLAAVAGCVGALATFQQDRQLSIATVRLSVEPGGSGFALYVPLVDWGVRFDAVRLPAELRLDVRALDRPAAERIARNNAVDVGEVRRDARDAIAGFLRALVLVVLASGCVIGGLVALAVRSRAGPRLRWLAACVAGTAVASALAVALLLPPRGALDEPEYFAHGADIPRALAAVEAVSRSAQTISEELDAQLVGLARLVVAPSERAATARSPRLTLASDLHNNVLVLPALRRAARGGPLFLAGDLSDSGSRLEASVTRAIARVGDPVVFVTGNHDSAAVARELARSGAVVLTARGRLLPDGEHGPRVVRVGGLRVAGYEDPFMRRPGQQDAPDPDITPAQQTAFDVWLAQLEDEVDVVMVHNVQVARLALERLAADPPARPLVFLVGHSHTQYVEAGGNVVVLNAGTAGGGGTGNLVEHQPIGLAALAYAAKPRFAPLAVDLVEIDPGSGEATATHRRLDLASERPRETARQQQQP